MNNLSKINMRSQALIATLFTLLSSATYVEAQKFEGPISHPETFPLAARYDRDDCDFAQYQWLDVDCNYEFRKLYILPFFAIINHS